MTGIEQCLDRMAQSQPASASSLWWAGNVADSGDVGADGAECLFDFVVAAVHVVDAILDGLAVDY